MREAFLSNEAVAGSQPVFTRVQPLSKAERLLLEQAQEPANKARYSYYDCQQHGIFAVDNEAGLTEITCPRRGKCKVREVFDPAGYTEHYTEPAPEPAPAPVPAPVAETGQVGDALGFPPSELKRRLERVLEVEIPASPEAIAQGFREGLAFIDYNQEPRPEREEEPEEPAEPQLTDIEHYASLQFTPAQVCLVLGLDLATQGQTPEFKEQMQRGQLIQVARLRGVIFQHANNGSAPAQMEALKIIEYANVAKAGNYDE